jgi:hypothetical protein
VHHGEYPLKAEIIDSAANTVRGYSNLADGLIEARSDPRSVVKGWITRTTANDFGRRQQFVCRELISGRRIPSQRPDDHHLLGTEHRRFRAARWRSGVGANAHPPGPPAAPCREAVVGDRELGGHQLEKTCLPFFQ